MGRGSHNTDSKRYFDWLYCAWCDRMSAEMLIRDKTLYPAAAFHCQQCIEKALKAYLLFKNRKLFDGHNLTWLCKQAALTDCGFKVWIEESTLLNRYYIETRYPADILLEISAEEISEIMESASEMLDFICRQVKFDYSSYHKRKR